MSTRRTHPKTASTGAEIIFGSKFDALQRPLALYGEKGMLIPVMICGEPEAVYDASALTNYFQAHDNKSPLTGRRISNWKSNGLVVVQVGDHDFNVKRAQLGEKLMMACGFRTSPAFFPKIENVDTPEELRRRTDVLRQQYEADQARAAQIVARRAEEQEEPQQRTQRDAEREHPDVIAQRNMIAQVLTQEQQRRERLQQQQAHDAEQMRLAQAVAAQADERDRHHQQRAQERRQQEQHAADLMRIAQEVAAREEEREQRENLSRVHHFEHDPERLAHYHHQQQQQRQQQLRYVTLDPAYAPIVGNGEIPGLSDHWKHEVFQNQHVYCLKKFNLGPNGTFRFVRVRPELRAVEYASAAADAPHILVPFRAW